MINPTNESIAPTGVTAAPSAPEQQQETVAAPAAPQQQQEPTPPPATPAAPAPAPQTTPDQQGPGDGKPAATVVDAIGDFYEAMDGERPDRKRIELAAQEWKGNEKGMWEHFNKQYNGVLSTEDIDYMVATYDNPYSSKKKPGSNASPAGSSAPSTSAASAPTAEVPSPAATTGAGNGDVAAPSVVAPQAGPTASAVPFTPQQTALSQLYKDITYGTGSEDYRTMENDVARREVAQLKAIGIREGSGGLNAAGAQQQRARVRKQAEESRARIATHSAASIPLNPQLLGFGKGVTPEQTNLPERVNSVYHAASDYFTKAGKSVDYAWQVMNEEAADLLGTTVTNMAPFREGLYNPRYARDMSEQDVAMLREGKSSRYFTDSVLDFTGAGDTLFSADLTERVRSRLDDEGIEVPPALMDVIYSDTGRLLKEQGAFDEPGNFGRFDSPFNSELTGGVIIDMVEGFAAEQLGDMNLSDEHNIAVRRRLAEVAKQSYGLNKAQERARAGLTRSGMIAPDDVNIRQTLDRADEIARHGMAQIENMRDVAQGRIDAMGAEFETELAEYDAIGKSRLDGAVQNLELLLSTGQMDQETAEGKLAETQAAYQAMRSGFINDKTAELARLSSAFETEQQEVYTQMREQAHQTYSAGGMVPTDDGEGYTIDPQILATHQALIEQDLGQQRMADKRREQANYHGLSRTEKVARALETGRIGLIADAAGFADWMGFDELGYQVSQRTGLAKNALPLFDSGEFSYSDMANGDWLISNAVPMVPLLSTLLLPGLGGANLGTKIAAAANLGKTATYWTQVGSAAVASRFAESGIEAGNRFNQSLEMGKTREEAGDDAAHVWKSSMALIGLDVIQYGLALKPLMAAGKSSSLLRRAGVGFAGFGGSTASEMLEEGVQGYASTSRDQDITFLDYLVSPEGKHATALGGVFGAGFHIATSNASGYLAETVMNYALRKTGKYNSQAESFTDTVNRMRQVRAAFDILHMRGEISEEVRDRANRQLTNTGKAAEAVFKGNVPKDVPEFALTEYVEKMATVETLKQEIQQAKDRGSETGEVEAKQAMLRSAQDRMAEIESGSPDLVASRLNGVPVDLDTLAQMTDQAEVIGHINLAEELSVDGSALERVHLFTRMGELDAATIGQDNAEHIQNQREEAIVEMSQDPSRPGGVDALLDYARANHARGMNKDGEKWGSVVKTIEDAQNGMAGVVLTDHLRAQDSSPGMEASDAAADAQRRMRRDAAEEEIVDEGNESDTTRRTDRVAEAAANKVRVSLAEVAGRYFTQYFGDDAAMRTVRAENPELAARVEQAQATDQVSLADQMAFNQLIFAQRAKQGSGGVSAEAAAQRAVDPALRQQQATYTGRTRVEQDEQARAEENARRGQVWVAMEEGEDMWSRLQQLEPELYGRTYEDAGLGEASQEDVADLITFIEDIDDDVSHLAEPQTPTQEYSRRERRNFKRKVKESLSNLAKYVREKTKDSDGSEYGPDLPVPQKLGLSLPKLGPTEALPSRAQKYYAAEEERIFVMANLEATAHAAIEMGEVSNYADFVALVENEVDNLNAGMLNGDNIRAAYDQAVADLKLRSDNPIEFYSQMGRRDQFVRTFIHARHALALLEGKLKVGEGDSAIDSFDLERSRVATLTERKYREIRGVMPGTHRNADEINRNSMAARWEEQTGEPVTTMSLFFYAKHARDFNRQARAVGQERFQAEVDKLQDRLDYYAEQVRLRGRRVRALSEQGREASDPDMQTAQSSMRSAERGMYRSQDKLSDLMENRHSSVYLVQYGSGMEDAMAERIIDEFSGLPATDAAGAESTFGEVAQEFYAEFKEKVIDARVRMAYEGGLIDQATYENMIEGKRPIYEVNPETGQRVRDENGNYVVTYENGFDNYVPLKVRNSAYSDIAGGEYGGDMLGKNGSAFVQSIKGSHMFTMLKRNDPVEQAMADYGATVKQVEHNRILNQVLGWAKANPDSKMWKVVRSSARPVFNHEGFMTGMADNVPDHIKEHAVAVHVDGRVEYLHFRPIKNERGGRDKHPVLDAIEKNGMSTLPQEGFTGMLVAGMRTYVAVRRALITSLNPFFGIPNFARDFVDSVANVNSVDTKASKNKIMASMISKVPNALRALTQYNLYDRGSAAAEGTDMSNYLQQFVELGAPMSWTQLDGVEDSEANTEKTYMRQRRMDYQNRGLGKDALNQSVNVMTLMARKLNSFNNIFENTMRLSAYAAAVEAGVPKVKAAAVAKNISANFERQGTFTPSLNSFYLFANAGIQGTYRSLQNLKSPRGMAMLGGFFTYGVLMGLLTRGNDEYERENTDYDRNANFLLPVKTDALNIFLPSDYEYESGKYAFFKAPKPYGLIRMIVNLGENIVRAADGRDHVAKMLATTATDFSGTVDPIGGSSNNWVSAYFPTIAQFPVQYAMNENFMGQKFYFDIDPNMDTQEKQGRAPESFIKATQYVYDGTGGYINIAPVLAYEYLKDLGGGIPAEYMRVDRMMQSDNPNEDITQGIPLVRRFYDGPIDNTHKYAQPIYAQMARDKKMGPTPEELSLHRSNYQKLNAHIIDAAVKGYKPVTKRKSLNRLANEYYKKFGVSLVTDAND